MSSITVFQQAFHNKCYCNITEVMDRRMQSSAPSSAPPTEKHTPGHFQCPECEKRRALVLQPLTADLPFAEAAERYMRLRSVASTPGATGRRSARYIKENTRNSYSNNFGAAKLFFGETRLNEIQWFNLRAYQDARADGADPFLRYRRPQDAKPRCIGGVILPPKGKTPCPAKPQQVNQETRLIKKIMMLAGCWTAEHEKYFENLIEEESDVQRALQPSEQQLWLDACRSQHRWDVVLWWSLIAFDLICSPGELRGQQIANIDFHHQMVRIPWATAKNPFRHRDIAISSPETMQAYERVMERARRMGATSPMHYLWPFKITRSNECDPARPMTDSGLKKLWQEVREATGLLWFRQEDTRHTGATRLAEAAVPAAVIMQRMGHNNLKMQQHYQQIGDQAQRMWMRHAQQFNAGLPPRIPPRRNGDVAAWMPSQIPVGNFS